MRVSIVSGREVLFTSAKWREVRGRIKGEELELVYSFLKTFLVGC